jgi:hypothetical protein
MENFRQAGVKIAKIARNAGNGGVHSNKTHWRGNWAQGERAWVMEQTMG